MSAPTYEPSLANIFLAIVRGENAQPEPTPQMRNPVTCPNCLSEDTKPVDERGTYECTVCGEVFNATFSIR
jgi:hypothetical protein